jgi:hypothetical protein
MNFRKKTVVIEAFQWRPGRISRPDWATDEVLMPTVETDIRGYQENVLLVRTPEGLLTARSGDWIIRGVEGEVYPCRPDVFAATYEAVD